MRYFIVVALVVGAIVLAGPDISRAISPRMPEPSAVKSAPAATLAPPDVFGYPLLRDVQGRSIRLMVQEGAYYLQQRALDENDSKTLGWVWDAYEHLDIPDATPVGIIKQGGTGSGVNSGTTTQVQVLLGEYTGRRGWVSSLYLKP